MAKYTVDYLCGHSGEVRLFGKHKDRERKIEWLADQRCWKCQQEQAGPSAYLFIRFPVVGGVKRAQAVLDVANSFSIKDSLKLLGFRFEREAPDACGQVLGLLSFDRPPAVWRRVFDLPSTLETGMANALQSIELEAKSLVRDGLVKEDNLHLEIGGGGLTALHACFDPVMPFDSADVKTTEG